MKKYLTILLVIIGTALYAQTPSSNRSETTPGSNVEDPASPLPGSNRIEEPGETNNIQNLGNNRIEEPGETNNIQNLGNNRIEEPGETNNIQNLSSSYLIVKTSESDSIMVKDILKTNCQLVIDTTYTGSSYEELKLIIKKK